MAGQLGVRLERRLPLDPLLLAVMIEQLVPGDPVDPRDRGVDATSLLQLRNGGEERLLRQILREGRGTAATV